jgi:hypothetical protein
LAALPAANLAAAPRESAAAQRQVWTHGGSRQSTLVISTTCLPPAPGVVVHDPHLIARPQLAQVDPDDGGRIGGEVLPVDPDRAGVLVNLLDLALPFRILTGHRGVARVADLLDLHGVDDRPAVGVRLGLENPDLVALLQIFDGHFRLPDRRGRHRLIYNLVVRPTHAGDTASGTPRASKETARSGRSSASLGHARPVRTLTRYRKGGLMLAFLNDLLWGHVLIYGLIAAGLGFTIASRFVQFRYFGAMFGILRQAFHHEAGHLSSFQALMLSVAGRVGAGNIAGVAVAITLGGPGAVFWMWMIGLIGMATSYFECALAQLYKNAEPDGTYRGGPAYYIERGLGQRWLAGVFSGPAARHLRLRLQCPAVLHRGLVVP